MSETEIRIENARSHNLKGVSCRIPLRSLCVVTGVSGSGKSSLAFDTLYAEGQRRYVTSLSTYARQFLERFPRPEVDSISSLPPAIAIEQRNRVTNARSIVGSATEILDHLRLLFARAGRTRCPDCDEWVTPGNVSAVAERIAKRFRGERINLTAPLTRSDDEAAKTLRDRLTRDGFVRVLDEGGVVHDLVETQEAELDSLLERSRLLIDRLALSEPASDDQERRVAEAVATAFSRGHGLLDVVPQEGSPARYLEGFACDGCGRRFATPEPSLFSFNSPLGACPSCQGFGRIAELDWERVVSEPERSLDDHAIAPFATPMGRSLERDLLRACREVGVPTDVAFAKLDESQRIWVLEGDDDVWYGVRGFFEWLEGRRYKVQARVLIARYRRYVRCTDCDGTRLCDDARAVEIEGSDIGELARLTITELESWLRSLELPAAAQARAERIVELLETRLATAQAVGLGYLSLDRQVRTLSGGEAQRIQLASALGGGLTSSLYVLDEPSVGLHPRDMRQLLDVLLAIRDQGNTVVVVEHAPEILASADHVIDLGPGAGRLGGRLLVEGDLEAVRECSGSRTGALLRGEIGATGGSRRPSSSPTAPRRLRVVGAREHNLKDVTVEIPLDQLVVVTGVSGAGKSSLVQSVLVDQLLPSKDRRGRPGECDAIEGRELIRRVVVVDQTPAVRSPRSNPATVSKAFDGIRQKFAATREARSRGFAAGWFSFNVAGGRCDTCEGTGEVVIDMQFLDDLRVPCDDCGGLRYRREVLEVRLEGRSIVDVLNMTIDEAADFFAAEKPIVSRLGPLRRVGLGYLTLGQPLSTLSGGENQRIRLANSLGDAAHGVLYVLDEPTTGLHAADVEVLMSCLWELVEGGASVLVIEHNMDVIRQADWLIDLGPEGGPGGGRVVAEGTPREVARVAESHTGQALGRDAGLTKPLGGPVDKRWVSTGLETETINRIVDATLGMRSYVEEIAAISARLKSNGAMGLILIDASALGQIEDSYGTEAFERTRDRLHQQILETCADDLADGDLVVSGEVGSEQVAIFLFRPRGHDVFYRESLVEIAGSLEAKFLQAGSKMVYPYGREAPRLPIGQALVFYNPGVREERQVREVLTAAAADARLNQRIEARNRRKLITDLVLSEEVTILYEPIVNVTTREIVGYEALVRGPWDSELHSPAALFGLAEEAGLVFELDCLCRRAALRGAKGLQPGKLLFLNCLPTAIHDPAFRGDVLRSTLEELRLRPNDMVFEISERESIDNFSIFREARDYYGELGFRVALDDTGVAYGSLEAIMELRPDFIKVDLSLVRSIDTDPPRQELLRALHTVALKLNAQVIAEGIETSEELATIQSLGIPLGQGYLFGRPAPMRRSL